MRDHPYSDETPFGDAAAAGAVEGELAHALQIAAERLLAAWRQTVPDGGTEAELREELGALLGQLKSLPSPGYEEPLDEGSAVVRRRVLELLRAELIQVWSSSPTCPPGDEMLRLLDAIEQLRVRLEPNWDQYFVSRLMGPVGLELVVEVAHDLRSPLTSILFLAETLRGGQTGDVSEVQRRQLGIIYSAALGLISVASDMIELARGGTQLMDCEPSSFSVAGILESVRDIVLPMAEEKGLELRLHPPLVDARLGYPIALSRVLLNLTSNALKFTEEGSIELATRPSGTQRLEFSVSDTGPGLEAEEVRTLFQPFRRRRLRKGHAFSGSGLGLMISRRLVAAMGSELQISTEPGRGTRFYFDLELPPIPDTRAPGL